MGSKANPKGRDNDLVVQELKGELLIYDLRANKAHCLNPTSARIWKLCDGERSVSEISRQLGMDTREAFTNELVWLAIDKFRESGLLAQDRPVEVDLGGLSRREAIRKVGLASLVALPLVTSLAAPTAAQAVSGGCGLPCVSPVQCGGPCPNCSGTCSVDGSPCVGGTPCFGNGTCNGTFTCSQPGGVCAGPGACMGPTGTPGICNFSGGFCSAGGAPCAQPGPCIGNGICSPGICR